MSYENEPQVKFGRQETVLQQLDTMYLDTGLGDILQRDAKKEFNKMIDTHKDADGQFDLQEDIPFDDYQREAHTSAAIHQWREEKHCTTYEFILVVQIGFLHHDLRILLKETRKKLHNMTKKSIDDLPVHDDVAVPPTIQQRSDDTVQEAVCLSTIHQTSNDTAQEVIIRPPAMHGGIETPIHHVPQELKNALASTLPESTHNGLYEHVILQKCKTTGQPLWYHVNFDKTRVAACKDLDVARLIVAAAKHDEMIAQESNGGAKWLYQVMTDKKCRTSGLGACGIESSASCIGGKAPVFEISFVYFLMGAGGEAPYNPI